MKEVDSVLGRLSKEKDTSAKLAKKLESELAFAKGEILHLKKQMMTMDGALKESKTRVQKVAQVTICNTSIYVLDRWHHVFSPFVTHRIHGLDTHLVKSETCIVPEVLLK